MNDSNPEPLDDGDSPVLDSRDSDLDALCENWVYWCRSRRLYWPASAHGVALARQGAATRPLRPSAVAASASASLAAFHIAYTCQPDSLDKQVFDLYYVARVKPIKTAAAALGIGRAHFYRVLQEFRRRLASAATSFEQDGVQVASLVVRPDSQNAVALHGGMKAVNTESVSSRGDNLDHQHGPPVEKI